VRAWKTSNGAVTGYGGMGCPVWRVSWASSPASGSWSGQLLDHPGVGLRLQDRLLTVSPMDRDALERAVTVPTRVCGVIYDEGLAQRIALEAAGGDGGLSLMEFALAQLWPRQRRRRLRFAD
jgi:hypothetical protein